MLLLYCVVHKRTLIDVRILLYNMLVVSLQKRESWQNHVLNRKLIYSFRWRTRCKCPMQCSPMLPDAMWPSHPDMYYWSSTKLDQLLSRFTKKLCTVLYEMSTCIRTNGLIHKKLDICNMHHQFIIFSSFIDNFDIFVVTGSTFIVIWYRAVRT